MLVDHFGVHKAVLAEKGEAAPAHGDHLQLPGVDMIRSGPSHKVAPVVGGAAHFYLVRLGLESAEVSADIII